MISTPKVVSVLACGVVLCHGQSQSAHAVDEVTQNPKSRPGVA
jgi:hypothetical protein